MRMRLCGPVRHAHSFHEVYTYAACRAGSDVVATSIVMVAGAAAGVQDCIECSQAGTTSRLA